MLAAKRWTVTIEIDELAAARSLVRTSPTTCSTWRAPTSRTP